MQDLRDSEVSMWSNETLDMYSAQIKACFLLLCRSQMSNAQCLAAQRPPMRRPCNSASCDLADGNLTLVYSPWSVCDAACSDQSGDSDRAASCVSPDGGVVSVDMCAGYSGKP